MAHNRCTICDPAHLPLPTPSIFYSVSLPPINNLKKVVEVARSNHLLVLELYARLGLTPPATGTPTWSKAFSYTCRYCAENDHWTKDCPNPHRFDICYASHSEIQKALDNKLKAESPALLDSPKDEDNVIPIQAAPATPEPETPPTLSTPLSEENPLCTSNPLGAAPPETPASGRRLPKGGAIVRATSPYLTLSPALTAHIPTLHLVEHPYIPPDPRTYRNTLGLGSETSQQRGQVRN